MEKVGYRTGHVTDAARLNWDGAGPRPIRWSAWYPAAAAAGGAGPEDGLFELGAVVEEAELGDGAPFPTVLMSHGTGGSPESLGWLAAALARAGYVTLAPHHHGNTGSEAYRAEGFLAWWERGPDLSVLLSALAEDGPFAGQLDLGRVHALGFSLGCYAVLGLAGAAGDMARFQRWMAETPEHGQGPREFPDLAVKFDGLIATSDSFRAAWARQSEGFSDSRVRSVTAIAAPPPVRAFDAPSLRAIDVPVTLITGEADREAPTALCSAWLAGINPQFRHVSMGADVGHYTFLGAPRGAIPQEAAFIFDDAPGVSRAAVHAATRAAVLEALSAAEEP
ncbi:MAG: dienelactone hydrolase [Pseudomonadota bacterium]